MERRTIIVAGIFLALIAGLTGWGEVSGLFSTRSGSAREEEQAEHSEPRKVRMSVLPPVYPAVQVIPGAEEIAVTLNSKETTPLEDLENLDLLIGLFRKSNQGANPAGGVNDEIVAQLAGRNEKGAAVLPPKHPALSNSGELLDRWGTPYYFHPISRNTLGLRSAGADGKLWTPDDVVLEPQ